MRMLGQHHKFDMDLLSYFLDAKIKHCSQMQLKTKCLVTGLSKSEHLFMCWTYVVNLIAMEGGEKVFGKPFDYIFTIWNKPKMHSVKFQNFHFFT